MSWANRALRRSARIATFEPMAEEGTQLALGGEKLDGTLRLAVCQPAPETREAVYRTLLECDLLIPVKELPESLMGVVTEIETEKFPSVPSIVDTEGRKAFPLFTNPSRLEAYAISAGWSQAGRPPLYVALPARFAYTIAFSAMATAVVVDPGGPFPFEGTLEEAGSMARGECPHLVPQDPSPATRPGAEIPAATALPMDTPPAAIVKPAEASAPEPAVGPPPQKPPFAVPDRLVGVLKVLLEQYPTVLMAVLYEQALPEGSTLVLGLKFDPSVGEVPPLLLKNLSTTLKKFLPGRDTAIESLPEGFEQLVGSAGRPIYVRASS